jgi:hypothetical protein
MQNKKTMRFVLLISGILLLGGIAHQFLPWYALVIAAFLLGLVARVGVRQSFLAGFAAGFLLWGVYAGYLNYLNDGLLGGRVGQLMGGMSPAMMVGLTGLLGGLLAGMGALSGNLGRTLFN